MTSRRTALLILASTLLLGACSTVPPADDHPPIIFVHGNGDTAALWQTTLWRFESNGWPADRLFALDMPYPLARDVDAQPQPGRTSSAEQMALLKAEVEKVMLATGARKVALMSNSRGGYAIRSYVDNGGGSERVSHAILGGAPNHGIWAIKGYREGNEFAGTGPFLSALNSPKNPAGDEVTGPVQWLTIRSDNNDKFAQHDGVWIGIKGTPTNITADGPALKGATNSVIAGADHRETSYSPAAFALAYRFISGNAPVTNVIAPSVQMMLNGKLVGLGLNPVDPASGTYSNNLPLPGAQLAVYATSAATGERIGDAVYKKTVSSDGIWGPFSAKAAVQYEFVISAPGYATTHIYRSPFPRSSNILHLRAERVADADKSAKSIVVMTRPRGYFDAVRDTMQFDGKSTLPGVPLTGAGVSSSKLNLPDYSRRPVSAEFNGEKITGQTWSAAQNHLTMLELTY